MNYTKIYNKIIDKRKLHEPIGYTETHHIIPRSLGGSDNKENLVKLTAREHFICHLLLTKIYTNRIEKYKMIHAFMLLSNCKSGNQERYVSSRRYEILRKLYSKVMSENQKGTSNSQSCKRWVTDIIKDISFKLPNHIDLPYNCVEGRNQKEFICKNCNKVYFKPKSNNSSFCSKSCSTKFYSKQQDRNRYSIKIEIDGIEYDSISEASKSLNILHETIRNRLKSKSFPSWKRL